MKITMKQVIAAAAVIIVAASVVRVCRSGRAPAGTDVTAVREGGGAGRVSGGDSSFFDWFFGGRAPREADVEQAEESGEEQPRMTSEMNDLAEKIEKVEKLPDSVWYPNSTNREEVEKHASVLRELFLLGTMVRAGSATPEQREKYLEMKMRLFQDKIDTIRQFQDKAGPESDREEGEAMLRRLEKEVNGIKDELRKQ